jgi:hypothetical protein
MAGTRRPPRRRCRTGMRGCTGCSSQAPSLRHLVRKRPERGGRTGTRDADAGSDPGEGTERQVVRREARARHGRREVRQDRTGSDQPARAAGRTRTIHDRCCGRHCRSPSGPTCAVARRRCWAARVRQWLGAAQAAIIALCVSSPTAPRSSAPYAKRSKAGCPCRSATIGPASPQRGRGLPAWMGHGTSWIAAGHGALRLRWPSSQPAPEGGGERSVVGPRRQLGSLCPAENVGSGGP